MALTSAYLVRQIPGFLKNPGIYIRFLKAIAPPTWRSPYNSLSNSLILSVGTVTL
ncbi:MAG: hypothetical protein AAGD25_10925 [Cyanobacteria bacterium P01_F01_bin.150]